MNEILLLGGNGFLGKGLQRELKLRNCSFSSLDKSDINLFDSNNINNLICILKNFNNIVILASKLGVKLFETNAFNASQYNKILHNNIFKAIQLASLKYKKSFIVTYYSTSEVFNSQISKDIYVTNNTKYSFDYSNLRYLYAYNKWQAELDYFKLQKEHPEIVQSIKIIRPFNIFGRNQIRGVVYDMIKSAINENKIYYSFDTTRTMTDIDFASKLSVKEILSTKNNKANIADDRNSLTMEALAHIIAEILEINCKFIKLKADSVIRYRNTSAVNADIQFTKKLMTPHILELAAQIKENI